MKNNLASTHWACFDSRKSFAKDESESLRKCPECARPMTDMGAYFEPPRKLNKKRWEVMKVLDDFSIKVQHERQPDLHSKPNFAGEKFARCGCD